MDVINTTNTLPDNVLAARDQAFMLGFSANQIFAQLAQQQEHDQAGQAQKGDRVKFSIYNLLNPTTDKLSQTVDPQGQEMSNSLKEVVIYERGDVVSTAEFARLTSFDNLDVVGIQLVGQNAAESSDLYARETLDSQQSSDYITIVGGGNKSSLGSGDIMTADISRNTATYLEGANVPVDPRFGMFVKVAHPNVIADLKKETGVGSWMDVAKYAAPEQVLKNEIGQALGYRWISSTNVKVEIAGGELTLSTTASAGSAVGAVTVTCTSVAGLTVGNWIRITHAATGNWYGYKIEGINGSILTLGRARYKNGNVYRASDAGLIEAVVNGDTVKMGVTVYSTYTMGFQAIGYGFAKKPEFRTTGPFDKMGRLLNMVWYAVDGYGELRPESLHKEYSASSFTLR